MDADNKVYCQFIQLFHATMLEPEDEWGIGLPHWRELRRIQVKQDSVPVLLICINFWLNYNNLKKQDQPIALHSWARKLDIRVSVDNSAGIVAHGTNMSFRCATEDLEH